MALQFVMSWYLGLNLDKLAAQRSNAQPQLEVEASRIAARDNYHASFASHDEIQVEMINDGGEVPPDNFGFALDDPLGSSEESGPYTDDNTGLDYTSATKNLEATAEEPAAAQPNMGAS